MLDVGQVTCSKRNFMNGYSTGSSAQVDLCIAIQHKRTILVCTLSQERAGMEIRIDKPHFQQRVLPIPFIH